MSTNHLPDPELQLTKVDGLVRLQRARHYLTGYYGGKPDPNDLQAAEQILRPLEADLLNELGAGNSLTSQPPRFRGSE
jgi:hypothetical protein